MVETGVLADVLVRVEVGRVLAILWKGGARKCVRSYYVERLTGDNNIECMMVMCVILKKS